MADHTRTMSLNHDDVYHRKMMHWQKQKGHYEPVHIHIHHDTKEQARLAEAAGQPLPTQLLRSVLSPMSGLIGGLQNMKIPGHHYVKGATKAFLTPPMSPTLVPSLSAQSPSPPPSPMSPMMEKDLKDLIPLTPAESSQGSLRDEMLRRRSDSPPPMQKQQWEVDLDLPGFHFVMPEFITSRPLLSSLVSTTAAFAGPPVFMYTLFVSGTLIFALSIALPICIVGALCFTVGCAALFGLTVILPSTLVASLMAIVTWMARWLGHYLGQSSSGKKPASREEREPRHRP